MQWLRTTYKHARCWRLSVWWLVMCLCVSPATYAGTVRGENQSTSPSEWVTTKVPTNLRSGPNLSTLIVAVLQPGVVAEVVEEEGVFRLVRRLEDDVEGYIRSGMLVTLTDKDTQAVFIADDSSDDSAYDSPRRFILEGRDITALLLSDEGGEYHFDGVDGEQGNLSVYSVDENGVWELTAGPDSQTTDDLDNWGNSWDGSSTDVEHSDAEADRVADYSESEFNELAPTASNDYDLPDLGGDVDEVSYGSTSNWTPALTVGVDAQLNEGNEGDAFPSERQHYQDFNVSAGLQGDQTWDAVSLTSQFDFVGASHHQNALRFSDEGSDAPKFDLSQYQVSATAGKLQLNVGHVNVGNHNLLIASHSARGISLSYSPFDRLRVNGGRLNTTGITGYDDLLGRSGEDRQIYTTGIEADAIKNDTADLTVGVTWVSGQRRSEPGFDVGEVTDAEKNNGLGLNFNLGLFNQRVSIEGEWASSRYSTPPDPFLAQGDALVAVDISRDVAWTGRFTINAVSDWKTALGDVSINVSGDASRADPLYKALAAYASADQENQGLASDFTVGDVSGSLRFSRSEDNVDNVPTILKTRSEDTASSLSLPLAQMWQAHTWLPSVNLSWGRSTQKAINDPDAATSGFNGGSHLPNQVNTQSSINTDWALGPVNLALSWSSAEQDNRQVGRDQADFNSEQRGLNFSWQIMNSLSFNGGINDSTQVDVEQFKENRSLSWNTGLGFNHRSFSLATQYSRSHDKDSAGEAESESSSFSADINWSGSFGKAIPSAQIFARYNRNASESLDNSFGFASNQTQWRWTAGLNLTFF